MGLLVWAIDAAVVIAVSVGGEQAREDEAEEESGALSVPTNKGTPAYSAAVA